MQSLVHKTGAGQFSEIKPASTWVEYRFYNQKAELAATGRQKGVYLYRDILRPCRLKPDERAKLKSYHEPETAKPD